MYPKKDLVDAWVQAALALEPEQSSFSDLKRINSFQVTHPIQTPRLACSVVIAQHEFPFSYGKPYKGKFKPKCTFNQVVATFESTVSGRQFDRVGALWIGGSEIWRYTTQEPSGNAFQTYWKAEKDVSKYGKLFTQEQDVVLSLDNVVDGTYTGIFNVTVTLNFYDGPVQVDSADAIIPISQSKTDYGWFTLPTADKPLYHSIPAIPNNTVKALVEVFISAHSQDEFWYGNVPDAVPDAGLYGGGSFKEVQLWINDNLVGLDWPLPTIYTGGFNPLLWRPIVAINAFDVPSMVFDVTPFLPLLFQNDSKIGFNVTNAANPFWFIDGNLLLYVDHDKDPKEPFNGTIDFVNIESVMPRFTSIGDLNSTLFIKTSLQNSFKATGTVYHSKGSTKTSVHKSVEFFNFITLNDQGNAQNIDQRTDIYSSTQVIDGQNEINQLSTVKYPFKVNLTYFKNDTGYEYDVTMDHGYFVNKQVQRNLEKTVLVEKLETNQLASGYFGTIRPGLAQLGQNYSYVSPQQCYKRNVYAYNREIMQDKIGC